MTDPCTGCGRDVVELGEYSYILRDEVWDLLVPEPNLICVDCVEAILGRKLTAADFDPDVPLNFYPSSDSPMLADRKEGLEPTQSCLDAMVQIYLMGLGVTP